ncbi:hypothetical membrane protein [Pelotomaculum thermopropionicum SI]|uniref:Hypothetical membrane protein n=1 Tax=Pelotomaculum thermopropionicum (strain DSM 13744 / JCM 10971 / SI) TaxID=370438 RepID=A5D5M3_PELTS|nr:hypothetical membrane protein [Pelotomaculum thermopropionicum SI]
MNWLAGKNKEKLKDKILFLFCLMNSAGCSLAKMSKTNNLAGVIIMNKFKSLAIISVLSVLATAAFVAWGFALHPRELWAAEQSAAALEGPEAAQVAGSLSELKERLWKASGLKETYDILEFFNRLPGPDAAAAQVLLDYLKEAPRTDVWKITDALVNLMTDDQVAQLARESGAYPEANFTSYLAPVLAARAGNAAVLADAILNLQKTPASGYYRKLVETAWQKVFADPGEAARWLDEVYSRLTDPLARENLVSAVNDTACELAGDKRAAAVSWLWQAQEQEKNTAARFQQLLNLYLLGEARALGQIKELYGGLASAEEKVDIVREAANAARWRLTGAARDAVVNWLWQAAEKDPLPFSRQQCLAALVNLGEKGALERLVSDIDENGLSVLEEGGRALSPALDWQLLQEAGEKYPQSYLARGIKAYEEVRGEPYFEMERRKQQGNWDVYFYGDEQYDPEREIPGWEKFLAEFPGHPGADDAAYRLARCYEIEGRWTDALNTLRKALSLPDGDIRYHAAGRLVYVLDVRMTYDQLKELSQAREQSKKLDPSLKPLVDYSLAVKELRRDNYRQTAGMLEEFLKQYQDFGENQGALPFNQLNYQLKYDFRSSVKKQQAAVEELAALEVQWKKSGNPADLYRLAAAIFHDQTLYYNHLWSGWRQSYNWQGYINATGRGRAPVEMASFAREMINYNHCLPYFQQVYRDPSSSPELKARALYSAGLCYTGLDEWGVDAYLAFTPSEIREKIISIYQQFIREYPGSSMADDALLALGAYTGDAGYLQKIVEDYPQGDMLEKAKNLMEEMKSPYYTNRPDSLYGWPLPFKALSLDDASVPGEVSAWAAGNRAQPFTGVKTAGGWSYLLVTAGEKPTAGYSVEIISISDDGRGRLKVNYRIAAPQPGIAAAQVLTYPYALARIPATAAAVEFAEIKN